VWGGEGGGVLQGLLCGFFEWLAGLPPPAQSHINPSQPQQPKQAMALAHSPGVVEVACNLLEPEVSPPKRVQAAIEAAAAREGLRVQSDGAYVIGKLPSEITAAEGL